MKANPVFSLYIPTKLVFGCGEIKKLSSEKLPGKKALVVISSGTSMRKYGYLERVLAQLRLNNVETLVYDKILPNPIKEHVMEAAAICREEKCDFVVGLGGGSSIDSAKSIAVMACNDGDYWDYVSGGSGKGRPVTKALPIIAIPTTAGTGTEMDPWTVITHETAQEKIGFGRPNGSDRQPPPANYPPPRKSIHIRFPSDVPILLYYRKPYRLCRHIHNGRPNRHVSQ